MLLKVLKKGCLLIATQILIAETFAAQVPTPPREVISGQVSQSIEKSVNDDIKKTSLSDLVPKSNFRASAQANANKNLLARIKGKKISRVIIQGSTVFQEKEMAKFFIPLANKPLTLQTLQMCMKKLAQHYVDHEYMMIKVIVPNQDFEDGLLRIKVIESKINKVEIKGDSSAIKATIDRWTDPLKRLTPIQKSQLEELILKINQIPGVTCQGELREIPQKPGQHNLILTLKHKRFQPYTVFDNNIPVYLGSYQLFLGSTLNSGITEADSTDILLGGNDKEIKYGRIQHSLLVNDNGTYANFAISRSDTKPSSYLSTWRFRYTNDYFSARLAVPLINEVQVKLFTTAEYTLANNRSTTFGVLLEEKKVRALRLGLSYSKTDFLQGTSFATLKVSKGLNGMGAKKYSILGESVGKLNFIKTLVYLGREQQLPKQFSLYAALEGQHSPSQLLSEEKYPIGGIRFGRAYDSAEIIGDRGLAGIVELRLNHNLDLGSLKKLQYYTCYDIGKVWNKGTQLPKKQSLASLGAGVRAFVNQKGFAELEVGKPLTKDVITKISRNENGKELRVFFRFSYQL